MLVEDDNNLREIYEARLLAEGYEIVSAKDGEEALATAVKEKPDLIISDVMMPKISGFDMLDILRSTPETKNTKVIMMTALSQSEDKARADKLGADRYLVKSQVTLEDVARVAQEVLSGEPSGPASPAPAVTTNTVPSSDPPQPAPVDDAAASAPTPAPAPDPTPVDEPASDPITVAVEPTNAATTGSSQHVIEPLHDLASQPGPTPEVTEEIAKQSTEPTDDPLPGIPPTSPETPSADTVVEPTDPPADNHSAL